MSRILRVNSFLRLEWLVHSPARAGLGVKACFGDDALAYCTERMEPEVTRVALAAALHQAKRNKAFENRRFIGLALDGTQGRVGCDRPGGRGAFRRCILWARDPGPVERSPTRLARRRE